MTGPICKCCKHSRLKELNAALLDDTKSLREITTEFGVAKSTLHAHKTRCMGAPTIPDTGERVRKHREKVERIASISRLQYLESQLPSRDELGGVLQSVIERLDAIVAKNEAEGGVDVVAVSGLSGIRQTVSDLAKLAGHIGGNQTQVSVGVNVNLSASDIGASIAEHLSAAGIPAPKLIEAIEVLDD